jgi:hypothetical protein
MVNKFSDNVRSLAANAASLDAPPPSPLAASGCAKDDAYSTTGSCSVPTSSIPTSLTATGASNAASDIWGQALNSLPAGDRAKLNSNPSVAAVAQRQPGLQTLPDLLKRVCDVAMRKKDELDEKSWSFELHGRRHKLRDVAGKIVKWVNLFKQVGDIAIQHDPGHAALPWAGVRFLLEVGEHAQNYTLAPALPLFI